MLTPIFDKRSVSVWDRPDRVGSVEAMAGDKNKEKDRIG